MTVITSASGLLAMLDEEEPALRVYALKNLNLLVGQFWAEISANISTIESLYEDETFDHRELAALLASKVFYYLGELTDSLTYALGAGSLFDVSEDSEYVQTLIAKCIDEYMDLSVKRADSHDPDADYPLDPRLVAIVERMLDNCIEERQFQQAIGVALECRRLDKLEAAVARSGNSRSLLAYCLQEWQLSLPARLLPAGLSFPCQPPTIPAAGTAPDPRLLLLSFTLSSPSPSPSLHPLPRPLFTLSLALSSPSPSPSLHPPCALSSPSLRPLFILPPVLSTLVRLHQQAETPDYGSICQMLMFLSDSLLSLPLAPLRCSFPQVLSTLVRLYQQAETPDYGSICQMLMFLSDAAGVAATLDRLIKGQNESDALLAYQVAFDLFENEFQQFLLSTEEGKEGEGAAKAEGGEATDTATAAAEDGAAKPAAEVDGTSTMDTTEAAGSGSAEAAGSGEGEAAAEAAPSEEVVYAERLAKLKGILTGETPIGLTLQFLYSHNKADLGVLKAIKQVVETRNSVCHSATIVANAFMHAGTTVDTFLRDNLDWLSRATNWAKLSATAGLGVIHRGHLQQGRSLMAPYLPHGAGGSAGAAGGLSGSAYSEGGALYALGLIHANHGESIKGFLLESLRNTSNETIQHGACLGVGLAAMGTGDEEVYEDVKSVLYTDSAVAGEAAGIAMGLLLVGSASERAAEMLAYAHDTQHEKIIRGLAVGISLVVYGREEEADILIQQMTTDADPILRYGGMYAIAMAYRGTANNGAIRQLLHFAVSDVSDDVRRAAVLCLGFVLCAEPDQVPRMVSLLAESFNPHVRYGAAMAVGIACAGTAQRSALDLLEPLTSDGVDFVRQGAVMATAMVLMQCSQEREPRVVPFRRQLEKAIHDKHEDTMCKMGAILASGILDAGGRNVTISLRSRSGYDRVTAVIGMALFTQYWYWFPLLHFLSLSFSATALVGLQGDLKAPKFDFVSECRPGLFAYPPPAVVASSSTAVKAPVAVLSTAARAKGRAKEKEEKKEKEEEKKDGGEGKAGEGGAMDGVKGGEEDGGKKGEEKKEGDAMEVEGTETTPSAAAEAKKPAEPTSEILHNPARVLPAQEKYIKFPDTCRYAPIRKPTSGRSGGGGGAGGRGRGGGAPPPPPPPADDDEEDDEPAPPEAFDFR
ncbi:unnamed protein product [Closterium sp. NIES-64]|nr:unnamed protein product [Closterium sp. NIES-64]